MLYSIDLAVLSSVYMVALALLAGGGAVIAITAARVHRVTGISWRRLLPHQMSAFMINLSTASQVAALPEHIKLFKDKLHIEGKFVDFALPLGIVLFMPCGAVFIGSTTWSIAAASGIALNVATILKIILVALIVAIAAPPIPGAAIAVVPIAFASCGLGGDMLPLGIIISIMVGYFLPVFNGLTIQLQIILSAKKLGKMGEPEI